MAAREQLDLKILDILQNDFPLVEQPYRTMAEQIGISEAEVLHRIEVMKTCGLIRRIGGIFDSGRMGFYSTLCALKVPGERINEVAGEINSLPGVTHNYLRDHDYNMWFTLTASSSPKAAKMLRDLENSIGLPIESMPTLKVYKIKVAFEVGAGHED